MAATDPTPLTEDDGLPPVLRRSSTNLKRASFAYHYVANGFDAPAAYKSAGYTADLKTCPSAPYKVLEVPDVQRMVRKELVAKLWANRLQGEDWALEKQLRLLGVDAHGRMHYIGDLLETDGFGTTKPKPMDQWNRASKRMLKGFKHTRTRVVSKDGTETITDTMAYEFHDQFAGLQTLRGPLVKAKQAAAELEAQLKANGDPEELARRMRVAMKAMTEADGLVANDAVA